MHVLTPFTHGRRPDSIPAQFIFLRLLPNAHDCPRRALQSSSFWPGNETSNGLCLKSNLAPDTFFTFSPFLSLPLHATAVCFLWTLWAAKTPKDSALPCTVIWSNSENRLLVLFNFNLDIEKQAGRDTRSSRTTYCSLSPLPDRKPARVLVLGDCC